MKYPILDRLKKARNWWKRETEEKEPFNTYIYLFFSWFCGLGSYGLLKNQTLFNVLMVIYLVLYFALYIRYAGKAVPKGKVTQAACLACFLITLAGMEFASL